MTSPFPGSLIEVACALSAIRRIPMQPTNPMRTRNCRKLLRRDVSLPIIAAFLLDRDCRLGLPTLIKYTAIALGRDQFLAAHRRNLVLVPVRSGRCGIVANSRRHERARWITPQAHNVSKTGPRVRP